MVVTFNSGAELASCLAGVPRVASLVVVDNSSSDDSVPVARRAGAVILQNERNLGFGAAANQGARLGSAPFVLFLNPDARLETSALDALVDACSRPGVAIAGAQLLGDDGEELASWWPIPSWRNTWIQALGLGRTSRSRGRSGLEVPSVVGAVMLVRREVFECLGGFDERFWLYGEETELCARCQDQGWKVVLVPEARAVHPGGASGRDIHPVVFEHFQLAGELIIEKRQGRRAVLAHRLGVVVGALTHLAANAVRRKGSPTENGRWRRVARRQLKLLWHSPARADTGLAEQLRSAKADA